MKWTKLKAASLLAISATFSSQVSLAAPPAVAPAAKADARAKDLLSRMTLEERLGLLHGPMPGLVAAAKRPADMVLGAGYIPGVPRLGIPPLTETDASLGVANLGNLRKGDVATALPSGLAMASSWDAALVERSSAMIGGEARAKGFNVMLAGGVNLVREPRNGRNFEYLGEDPLLAGVLAGHAIRGVQSNNIISTVKHFALNAQETGRNALDVRMDEAAMRESDLLAFETAIEIGDPGSVMCAYNRVNGAFACESDFLLNKVLKRDWNYKGWVMSDWGAVHSTEALLKGLDQQSGEQIDRKPFFGPLLTSAVQSGRVPAEAVDAAAFRILRTMALRGVLDHPVAPGGPIDYAHNALVAQDAAEAGAVLLKNQGGLLPIAPTVKRIVVIGGRADIGVLSGSGSSQVRPVGGPALEYKRDDVGAATAFATVTYTASSPLDALRRMLPGVEISFDDGQDVSRAAALAKAADLVLVFANQWTTEAWDVPDLHLPDGQDALIEAVATANPKTAVVLQTGGAVVMPWIDRTPAVLEAWYPGQRGGEVIARLLTGAANPSGHLPITFPASIEQTPNPKLPGSDAKPATNEDRATYGLMTTTRPFELTYPEGADVGYRWYERRKLEPLFHFGHGLSYTSFAYENIKVSGGKSLTVTFDVRNIGDRTGADVAQVYVKGDGSKRLVGWRRVELRPGERRTVSVTGDLRTLARFDVATQKWVMDAGTYQVDIGESAGDARHRKSVLLSGRKYAP